MIFMGYDHLHSGHALMIGTWIERELKQLSFFRAASCRGWTPVDDKF